MGRTSKNSIKKCVIITGMSGGGKSSALRMLEDNGFYAIDNLPPSLLPQLLSVLSAHQQAVKNGVAAVVDGRSGGLLGDMRGIASKLKETAGEVMVIFLDAADETLVRRFETTRRNHPFADDTTILRSIETERELVTQVREEADVIVDTTGMTMGDLRERLLSITEIAKESSSVIFSSFGFKYGLPQDADYVLDVRFFPNPNYVEELHILSGEDAEIQEYMLASDCLEEFLRKTEQLLEYILSVYGVTGKKQLHVAIGCTGGRHRSVAIAEMLARYFREKETKVSVAHRDINKGKAP